MSGNRNSLVFLLEIYEMLMYEAQTFHSIRSKIGIGFKPLTKLLEKLINDELVELKIKDGKKYYEGTQNLHQLFLSSFYEGIKRLSKL